MGRPKGSKNRKTVKTPSTKTACASKNTENPLTMAMHLLEQTNRLHRIEGALGGISVNIENIVNQFNKVNQSLADKLKDQEKRIIELEKVISDISSSSTEQPDTEDVHQ